MANLLPYMATATLPVLQAAYHAVPIVGLPLFAEQPDNMARATEQGFGLSVSVDDALGLTQNLRTALHRVLQNPSFAGNASRVSRLIRAAHWSPASQAASESCLHYDGFICVPFVVLLPGQLGVICLHLMCSYIEVR